MSFFHAGSILFEKTTTVSEHCNKNKLFVGKENLQTSAQLTASNLQNLDMTPR
jgi:hypothetical protein